MPMDENVVRLTFPAKSDYLLLARLALTPVDLPGILEIAQFAVRLNVVA